VEIWNTVDAGLRLKLNDVAVAVAIRVRLCVVVNVEAGCVEMDRLTDVVVL